MENERVELLRQSAFCRHLPDGVVRQLADIGELLTVSSGSCLFQEGDMHGFVYLVTSGSVILDIFVPGRGHVELHTIGSGEFIGWSPVITNSPMSVRAKTLEETQLIRFPAEKIRQLCQEDHEFGFYFMRQIALVFVKRLTGTRLQMLDMFEESAQDQEKKKLEKPTLRAKH